MRKVFAIPLVIIFASLSFAAGYCYRAVQMPVNAQLEDYALSNTLEDVANVHYLAKGDFVGMRSMLDVTLNGHVSRVRAHAGELEGTEIDATRTRTLNAVAMIWDRYPPFQSPEWKMTETNEVWWHEWAESHQKNLAFVRAAKERCAVTPALNCRARAPETLLPVDQK